ncbi:MAG: response regulator [Desulfobacterales bacterium]
MTETPTRVFIIDDDDSVRRGLKDLLQSLNYDVETFASAEQFLARKPFRCIGCIILDVRMPGLSGLDLQERLIQTEHSLPIVFITGHGDLPMGVDAMKKGAVDFLPKPFDDAQLITAVELALEKDRKARAEFGRRPEHRGADRKNSPGPGYAKTESRLACRAGSPGRKCRHTTARRVKINISILVTPLFIQLPAFPVRQLSVIAARARYIPY